MEFEFEEMDSPEQRRRLDARIASGDLIIQNEFGIVAVSQVGRKGLERLRIEDLRTGVSTDLDALELESLAWAKHEQLGSLLDPSLTRWRHEGLEDE